MPSEINPYESSQQSARDLAEVTLRGRHLRLTGLFVVAMALVGTFVGLGIGTVIGIFAPDFFVIVPVFARQYDPLQLGMGLGAVNGAMFGAGVGVLLVAVEAWRMKRRAA